MSRIKVCQLCKKEFDTMYRIIVDNSKKWIFSCEVCLKGANPNNNFYRYGGTWKK